MSIFERSVRCSFFPELYSYIDKDSVEKVCFSSVYRFLVKNEILKIVKYSVQSIDTRAEVVCSPCILSSTVTSSIVHLKSRGGGGGGSQ